MADFSQLVTNANVIIELQEFGQRTAFGICHASLKAVLALGSLRRKENWVLAIVLALLLSSVLFTPACAGGTGIGRQKQTGTAPGTYTVTVTGSSGSLKHALSLTPVVQ